MLAVLALVVMLSRRRGAIVSILLGLAATLAGVALASEWPLVASTVLRRGGTMLTFAALTWVVSHAVYAPGRITFHRLQGAAVVYLNLATIFAATFSLIWELSPLAFTNLPIAMGGSGELATMMYFSLTTLTTTGYGDIVPVDPFARSLAKSGVGSRAILSRHHGGPPRDAGTGRSAPLTLSCEPDSAALRSCLSCLEAWE